MLNVLALMLIAPTAQTADPLAPAKRGEVQCVTPNREKKTCMAMSTYKQRPDGSYESVSTILIAPPAMAMEVTQVVKVQGDQVCGAVQAADFKSARILSDGTPVDEASANSIRAQVAASIAAMDGKMACSRERKDGDVLAVDATLDGVARPDLSQKLIWVKPSDGYKLGM